MWKLNFTYFLNLKVKLLFSKILFLALTTSVWTYDTIDTLSIQLPNLSPNDISWNDVRWIRNLISDSKSNPIIVNAISFIEWITNYESIKSSKIDGSLSAETERARVATTLDDSILPRFASLLYTSGNFSAALRLNEILFKRQNSTLGPTNILTVNTEFQMGLCYLNLMNYNVALDKFNIVYNQRVAILGQPNENTLLAQYYIANTYERLGNLSDALKLYKIVYDKQVTYLGPANANSIQTRLARNALLSRVQGII